VKPPVIHAVTNDEIVSSPSFIPRALDVMEALGARGAVHLRAPRIPAARLYELATELAEAQIRTESWLIVNERVDVALASGARGIQLTSVSMPVRDAREVAPGIAVGASVHSLAQAQAAHEQGASWVVAGHVFATASHTGEPGRGSDFIAELAKSVPVPVIAIGGILPEHVADLRRAGAWGVAAIRGIWGADDAGRAAIDYLSWHDGDAK
jgi:thiazole tautomerase (transcriptional regulator TenI)